MNQDVLFERYRFEPSTGRLWSGQQEVRLTPKAAGVLGMLVARSGEPVTREELFAALWPDTVVTDDALSSCVQELRRALADNAKQPRFIETRHRRGYLFIAPFAVGGVAQARGKPTVVVLPFANLSGDPDHGLVAESMTEDIVTALSRHRSLGVIARRSTSALEGSAVDVRRVGLDLGAHYIVEGSVDKSGQRLRIRTRLIETEGGHHLWAEHFDRRIEDVVDLRDEITEAIAARIEPEVGAAERLRTERVSPDEFRAWDFFHFGIKHVYKSTNADNEEAQRLLRRAIALDPTLAEAYTWLSYATVLSMIYFDADPDDDRLNEAVVLAKCGVELDEQDALTHFGYGRALLARKEYRGAMAELEVAAALNPTLAVAFCGLGDSLAYEGRIDEAIPYFDRAITLSPFDPQRWAFYSYRALAHLFSGEFEYALEWSFRATRVPHCHYWPFAHRVVALGQLDQHDSASTARAELLQRKPDFSCTFARRRLFYVKNPDHVELYVEGLRKAGILA